MVYARTLDTTSLGSIVDKAVLVGRDGASRNADAEMAQVGAWTSLRTFIKYGCRWALRVPSEELVLELAAVADDQELISVIATPAYWEGQVRVTGSRRGVPMSGVGFVEQYFGAQNHDFRTMLGGVSEVVLRNVEAVYPLAPSRQHLVELTSPQISPDLPLSPPISGPRQHLVELAVSREFESVMEGLPTDAFVEGLIRPVRAITDRQGKGWRSMGLLLASAVVGGSPAGLERFTSFPEFLHTGSLIIDDIQDNSLLRRGGPCAHLEFGVATAINAGTAAYFLGEGITRDHPLTAAQRLRVYELYFTCLRGSHVGQALDLHGLAHMVPACLESGDLAPVWEALLCCHRLKSGLPASVCARTGAVLGGATPAQEAALGDYFLALGLAFQLLDDVINLQVSPPASQWYTPSSLQVSPPVSRTHTHAQVGRTSLLECPGRTGAHTLKRAGRTGAHTHTHTLRTTGSAADTRPHTATGRLTASGRLQPAGLRQVAQDQGGGPHRGEGDGAGHPRADGAGRGGRRGAAALALGAVWRAGQRA